MVFGRLHWSQGAQDRTRLARRSKGFVVGVTAFDRPAARSRSRWSGRRVRFPQACTEARYATGADVVAEDNERRAPGRGGPIRVRFVHDVVRACPSWYRVRVVKGTQARQPRVAPGSR